jgi:hypothetical protein
MKIGKVIIWGILAVAFTGMFIKGWFSFDLWDEIFLGLLAFGSWLMVYKEAK